MVYARQINPEWQESPLFIGVDEFWPEGLTICGNRDYRERWDENFKRVYDALENGELADALDDFERYGGSEWYKSRTAAIMDLLWPAHKERYSTKEIRDLCNLIPEYGYGRRNGRDDDDVLCDVAAVVLGKRYGKRTIRGCCQRDWNYVFYPADEWSREELDNFETEYFNTGTEWMVQDDGEDEPEDPEDICGYTVYCHDWHEEGIRREIADAAGCKPEDVVLYHVTGVRHVSVCSYSRS